MTNRELSERIALDLMGWETKVMRGPIERPTEVNDPNADESFGLIRYWKRPGQGWASCIVRDPETYGFATNPACVSEIEKALELRDKHTVYVKALCKGLGFSWRRYLSVSKVFLLMTATPRARCLAALEAIKDA